MSTENTPIKQEKKLQKKQELRQQEVGEVLAFLNNKKITTPVYIAVIAICGVALTTNIIKSAKNKKLAKASTALIEATSAEGYLSMADQYDSTPYAPIALLNAACLKVDQGAIDDAENLYNRFLKDYSDHEMAPLAQFCKITCTEIKGGVADAANQYKAFATEHADSYLRPAAQMAQARCLESEGQLEKAQQIYEELSLEPTEWQTPAGNSLVVLKSKLAL